MGLLDILLVILVLLASALCIYLIVTLKNVNKNLDVLQRDLSEISDRIIPILENLQEVSNKTLFIIEEAENQINKVQLFVNNAKNKIAGFGSRAGSNPENRISSFVSNLRAISKAVSAFLGELKNK